MFRSVDKAKYLGGLVSNPSHIYRVEMVEEDGLIFPIIELYTPQKKKRGVKYRKEQTILWSCHLVLTQETGQILVKYLAKNVNDEI